jgi:hypothetical protein
MDRIDQTKFPQLVKSTSERDPAMGEALEGAATLLYACQVLLEHRFGKLDTTNPATIANVVALASVVRAERERIAIRRENHPPGMVRFKMGGFGSLGPLPRAYRAWTKLPKPGTDRGCTSPRAIADHRSRVFFCPGRSLEHGRIEAV